MHLRAHKLRIEEDNRNFADRAANRATKINDFGGGFHERIRLRNSRQEQLGASFVLGWIFATVEINL